MNERNGGTDGQTWTSAFGSPVHKHVRKHVPLQPGELIWCKVHKNESVQSIWCKLWSPLQNFRASLSTGVGIFWTINCVHSNGVYFWRSDLFTRILSTVCLPKIGAISLAFCSWRNPQRWQDLRPERVFVISAGLPSTVHASPAQQRHYKGAIAPKIPCKISIRDKFLHWGSYTSKTRIWGRILGNEFRTPEFWTRILGSKILSSFFQQEGPQKNSPSRKSPPKFTFQNSTQKSGVENHIAPLHWVCRAIWLNKQSSRGTQGLPSWAEKMHRRPFFPNWQMYRRVHQGYTHS